MASNPDGNGIILVGGSTASSGKVANILELKLKAEGQGWVGSWTTLTAKLQYPRSNHVVIPVFMDKENCELNGRKSLETTIGNNTNLSNVKNDSTT